MHWSSEKNADFSTGKPWLKVNANYTEINVEKQLREKDSILQFYKDMIQLKKKHTIFTYGSYDLLLPDDEQIFAYKRELDGQLAVIVTNLSDQETVWEVDDHMKITDKQIILSNYKVEPHEYVKNVHLKPYEARVYLI